MDIYLIRTPEFEPGTYVEVHELLKTSRGPLQFHADDIKFSALNFPFLEHNKKNIPLSWQELFSICDFYRKKHKVRKEEIIILLTNRRNDRNFFSAFDEHNNSFIHAGDLEKFINSPPEFPLAYQVIANILRMLMKISPTLPESWFHRESIGCMNDLCSNKKEIILKLRTGDICLDCLAKMKKEKVDETLINQAIGIFDMLRKRLLFVQGFTGNITPRNVFVDRKGKIVIGDKEILLDYLPKTLFLFFLIHNEGIALNDLEYYRQDMLKIYRILRPGGEESAIKRLSAPYTGDGTFAKNKSLLNKKLRKQLGEPLAGFYCLEGVRGEKYSIGVDPGLVRIELQY
ncbi:MAG TPA: hypothetical protein PLB59_01205 [Bacteroidales bacterium]|nr:hypothetical protein [Bacteroidales bacterium]HQP14560.1 hypothetical protein [Bacteroidales bacterium]